MIYKKSNEVFRKLDIHNLQIIKNHKKTDTFSYIGLYYLMY